MRDSSKKFYNIFSFFYPIVDIFLKKQKKVLFQEINHLQEGDLLEIGVGNGIHLPLYNKHNIIAIDTSSKMLEIARKHSNKSIVLFEMNGKELLFGDATFDIIVLSHVISVVRDPDKLLMEVNRVLKEDGKLFILNHFTPNNFLKYIDYLFNPISKLFYFKSNFQIKDIKSIENFKEINSISFGQFSYFKLLVYMKYEY